MGCGGVRHLHDPPLRRLRPLLSKHAPHLGVAAPHTRPRPPPGASLQLVSPHAPQPHPAPPTHQKKACCRPPPCTPLQVACPHALALQPPPAPPQHQKMHPPRPRRAGPRAWTLAPRASGGAGGGGAGCGRECLGRAFESRRCCLARSARTQGC